MFDWLKSYRDPKLIALGFLGISSGLPLALILGTLTVWMTEEGISKTTIGLFASVGLPYTLKFLWAPFIDKISIPVLSKLLGQRRSWLLVSQGALILSIILLGTTDPVSETFRMAQMAFLVAICSATQDIVIDGYRIQILKPSQYGAGGAMEVFGYRLGMILAGAGALYLATFLSWPQTYTLMAALISIGMVTTLLLQKDTPPKEDEKAYGTSTGATGIVHWVEKVFIAPFSSFMVHDKWVLALLFVILYKIGDAIIGQMAVVFYLDIGFTKIDIANASKIFGIWATIIGGLIGGGLVTKIGTLKSLFIFGLTHLLTNVMFIVMALSGADLTIYYCAVVVENVTGGMTIAASVAYMSSLCNLSYSASQYALLSALAHVPRMIVASSSGWLATQMGWIPFFGFAMLLGIPSLMLIKYIPQGRGKDDELTIEGKPSTAVA
ncbi:MAG: MFS transporter [Alphaproteobacteria bacterium]|mgnify:CR=1 FL=1|jgi:MFS transporter, PAT family, beta-lactamase induction signal transducer AmpG|nr:MFS transporter [Alphaproteobacteria bacterium]MBT5390343.1 MFS transporter [Alphaproteobacteria bacterium]MBT5539969.1 MFS transporter [Alphaproteobacteria bacterium]MBT5653944.1 MFS transporter [Alphaproteobacteria bacterium]